MGLYKQIKWLYWGTLTHIQFVGFLKNKNLIMKTRFLLSNGSIKILAREKIQKSFWLNHFTIKLGLIINLITVKGAILPKL